MLVYNLMLFRVYLLLLACFRVLVMELFECVCVCSSPPDVYQM